MPVNALHWQGLMWPGLAVVTLALAMTAGLIVVLRPFMVRYALARPNARSSHRTPTPQGGGIAIVLTVMAVSSLALQWFVDAGIGGGQALLPVFFATALLAGCGAIDDISALGVVPRLLLQTLAVVIVVAALPPDLRIFDWLPSWAERALLVVAAIWFVNLVNFMDGLDWMTVAEVVPVAFGLVIVGALDALPTSGSIVALALLGAMLGFAPFNRPVARLFLGDVGSLPIGLLLGWLLVHVAAAGHIAAALLLPLYYLADATVTLLRRIGNGEEIWQAHRTHFYQRATANGFSVTEIVTRVFVANLCLMALAVASVAVPSTVFDVLACLAGCILVGVVLVGFVKEQSLAQPQS